jgi:hypothetical protein
MGASHYLPNGFSKPDIVTSSSHQAMIGSNRLVEQNPEQNPCENVDGVLENSEGFRTINGYRQENQISMQPKVEVYYAIEFLNSVGLNWFVDCVALEFSGYNNVYDRTKTLVETASNIMAALSAVTHNSEIVRKYRDCLKQELEYGPIKGDAPHVAETLIGVSTNFLEHMELGWIPSLIERKFPGFHNIYTRNELILFIASKIYDLINSSSLKGSWKLVRSESSNSIQVQPRSPNPVMAPPLEPQNSPKGPQIMEYGSPVVSNLVGTHPPRSDSTTG